MLAAGLRGARTPLPAGLLWRHKQIQRQDWPTTLKEDAEIKRGHTPAQFLRLAAAMCLLDAGVGPTDAVVLARENENTILAIMASLAGPRPVERASDALVGVLRPLVIDGENASERARRIDAVAMATAVGEAIAGEGPVAACILVDFARCAERALGHLDDDVREAFDQVMSEGVRQTLAGRGRVPSDRPAGDRYRSRRARGRDEGRTVEDGGEAASRARSGDSNGTHASRTTKSSARTPRPRRS